MIKSGYLIDYCEQTSLFYKKVPGDNYTESRKALVSRETLSQMLKTCQYLLFTACFIADVRQYMMNADKPVEIMSLKKKWSD